MNLFQTQGLFFNDRAFYNYCSQILFSFSRNKVNSIRLLDANDENQSNVNDEVRHSKNIEAVKIFESLRNESYQNQIKLYKNLRKSEVLGMVDKIVEGKKRKSQSYVSKKRYIFIFPCNSSIS